MGNDNTKIKKSEFSDILQGVRYTPEEISKIHKSFLLNFPKGKISRLNFLTTYSKMFENYAEAQEFTDHMFRAYDENKDGEISFKEFLITLNTKNKGTKEDKLRWAFRMYDVDGNKQISHAEIIEIL
ncbi:hypothetical protein HELRODRAFT_125603, partial [Helobdella robusta]|uniref:EF-hand domain-containing protein n=1 Tax=Helobdella robusta TaxID=6412 RepID=T1EH69_HELRO